MSNISQMPIFVDSSATQLISMPAWILLAFYCLFTGRWFNLSNVRATIGLFLFFIFIFMLLSIVDELYLKSSLPLVMAISMFVLVIGTCVGPYLSDKGLNKIYACYIASATIVGISVYLSNIANQNIEGSVYLYDSKNSLSQILLTAWCMILFTKLNVGNKVFKLAYILIFVFLTYEICVLKSRATIIVIPIILIIALAGKSISSSTRIYVLLFILGFAMLLTNDNFLEFFLNNIIYGGRDANDLSDLSSGRSEEWQMFGMQFSENPLFGVGRCKRESIILTALLEFGLLGGIPLLLLAVQPLVFAKNNFSKLKDNIHFLLFVALAFAYCINGIFEQLAPFGPGVKCYFLWFLFGIISSKNTLTKQQAKYE